MADSPKPPKRGDVAPLVPPRRGGHARESVASAGPKLRLIRGEGQARDETLHTRDDVARLLVASAADMLLRRISTERAHEIEMRVDRIMRLFDKVDRDPIARPLLRRELDELERIWREGKRK